MPVSKSYDQKKFDVILLKKNAQDNRGKMKGANVPIKNPGHMTEQAIFDIFLTLR